MSRKSLATGRTLVRPVRLGVYFDQKLHSGGVYQQAINVVNLVKILPQDIVKPILVTSEEDNIAVLKEFGLDVVCIPVGTWQKIVMAFRQRLFYYNPRGLLLWKKVVPYNSFEKKLVLLGIDLMFFISPSILTMSLEVTNYMATLWDLCHRDELEFPEVRLNRIFERREKLFRSILPKAVAVFVDSSLAKVNAVRWYGLVEERIHVLPFSPAPVVQDAAEHDGTVRVNIHDKYSLDVPYVYYPAQFWSHKNHVYLLEGLRILEDKHGVKVGAIFSGGDQGNLSYVKSVVEKLGLEGRVRFAGFVDNNEVPLLYRQSVALVMPTYFGPTNLPPLEAFSLGVPVLYPDKAGLRDQVGDGALLIDLADPGSMALHLKELVLRPELQEEMIRRGQDRLKTFSDETRVQVLDGVLRDFQRRMACWSG
jgi:glycosyltransferase involved in cell wall biosynthesis